MSVLLFRHPEVCAAELDGEVCLFHPETAQYLNLNATASAIWRLLEQPLSRNALVTALVGDLGYQAATAIAAEQAATGEALAVVAARHGIDAARWIELTRPERVLRLGDRPIAKGPRP